jgi:hypothetical protein
VQVGGQRQLVVQQGGAHQRHDGGDALVAYALNLGDGHWWFISFGPAPGARAGKQKGSDVVAASGRLWRVSQVMRS